MNQSLPRPAAGALTLICVALAMLVAPIAYAHEGEGTLVVEAQGDTGELTMSYVVGLTWANDGHPAADATVTATIIDPSGAPQTPVPMQSQGDDGRYSGTVTFPTEGTWTVRFTAVTPAATLEIVEEVTAPSTSDTTTTTQASNGSATSETEPASPAETEDDDDGGVAGLLAAAFLALIVGGGVVGAIRARRPRSAS